MSGENEYLIGADGDYYPLEEWGVIVTGMGDIPAEYLSQRGYGQHGETIKGWLLGPRTLGFAFTVDARNRPGYWERREELIDALRPNAVVSGATPVTYLRVFSDGSRRAIDGWVTAGLEMEPSEDQLAFGAAFDLRCPDPSFYDPSQKSTALVGEDSGAIAWPLSFDDDDDSEWYFDTAYSLNAIVTNAGTWRSWPVIEVAGPFTRLMFQNLTTGQSFTLAGDGLLASETLTITLTPGQVDLVDDDGNSCFDWLESGNVADFYLAPSANSILASGVGTTGVTGITVKHYDRWIAI